MPEGEEIELEELPRIRAGRDTGKAKTGFYVVRGALVEIVAACPLSPHTAILRRAAKLL
jgi:hypothetical protein